MQQLNNIGKDIPLGGKWAQAREGPGQNGVGRKEILGEDIGPGPGRVPGLFRQKGEVLFRSENSIFTKVR